MHVPHPRRRPRRILFLAGLAGLLASLVAPSTALGANIFELSAPLPNAGGYYTNPFGITVQVRVSSLGFSGTPHFNGDVDERISKVECGPSPWVSGGFDTPRIESQTVFVSISGDTPLGGITAGCTASFERRTYSSCSIFGCAVSDWFPSGSLVWTKQVRLDSSPPLIGAPVVTGTTANAAGWYRTPGTVHFTASDPHSGILFCTSGSISGPDATFKGVNGSCTNGAGLQWPTGFAYKYDATQPTLSPTVSTNQVVLGGAATAAPNATDATSGIESASCDPVDTSSVGSHAVECRATDRAGNSSTATASYSVVYGFSGFEQPVDPIARNVAKAGRTIPLKWRVTDDAGNPVTNLTGVTVSATSLACSLGTTTDGIEEYAAGGSGLQNLGDGWYQFNWSSPKSYAGSCKTVSVNLGDGVARTAAFEFTK